MPIKRIDERLRRNVLLMSLCVASILLIPNRPVGVVSNEDAIVVDKTHNEMLYFLRLSIGKDDPKWKYHFTLSVLRRRGYLFVTGNEDFQLSKHYSSWKIKGFVVK